MNADDDPFFNELPPPAARPALIPVQLETEADLWANLLRRRLGRRSLAILFVLLAGVGLVYVRSGSDRALNLTTDQLTADPIPSIGGSTVKTVHSPVPSAITATFAPTPSVLASVVCDLETTVDTTNGFKLGQISGWTTTIRQGIIFVSPANDFKKMIFLLPIYLADQNLEESVTKTVIAELQQELNQFGLTTSLNSSNFTATYQGLSLLGQFQTRLAGRELLIFGGWAAAAEWPAQQLLLEKMSACYQTMPATVMQTFTKTITDSQTTSVFTASYPANWAINNLSTSGFELNLGSQTVLRYARTEGVLGSQTTAGLLDQTLAALGQPVLSTPADSEAIEAVDTQGVAWLVQTRSFAGLVEGELRRGTITAAVANAGDDFGYGSATTITIVRETAAATWSVFAPLLDAVQANLGFLSPRPGQGLVLTPADPGAPALPLDGAKLSQVLRESLGDAAEVILTNYQAFRAPSGDRFLLPLVNREPTSGKFFSATSGQTEELEKITVGN